MVTEERTDRFAVRTTPTETAMLRKLAEADGLSVSDYIRLSIRRMYADKFGTKKP